MRNAGARAPIHVGQLINSDLVVSSAKLSDFLDLRLVKIQQTTEIHRFILSDGVPELRGLYKTPLVACLTVAESDPLDPVDDVVKAEPHYSERDDAQDDGKEIGKDEMSGDERGVGGTHRSSCSRSSRGTRLTVIPRLTPFSYGQRKHSLMIRMVMRVTMTAV